MARRRRSNMMNLDSLLDTVTNVVGFLVIVLVVVQLNISLSPAPPSAPMAGAATGPASASERKPDPELQKLKKEWDNLALEIKQAKASARNQPPEIRAIMDRQQDLTALLDKLEKALAKLKQKIEAAETNLAGLRKKIEDAIHNPRPKPKMQLTSVRVFSTYSVGDAKPAWASKKRVSFVCRRGRVYPMDFESLAGKFKDGLRQALGTSTFSPALLQPEKMRRLAAHFESHDVGDQYFRIRLKKVDLGRASTVLLTLEPRRETQGEGVPALRAGASRHANQLRRQFDPKRVWVQYFAFADSFEAYLAARAVAEKAGFQVGWRPLPADAKIQELIGAPSGTIETGPG